jgi:hypothetical protein
MSQIAQLSFQGLVGLQYHKAKARACAKTGIGGIG